ncbi:MAG: hypothetical protein CL845_03490 [Crocinitomicaceae bacterium]|nr:hypothetical protein [Crocinitomicaceae bacterium]
MRGIQILLFCAGSLWTGSLRSQSEWIEHGSLDLWTREGDYWQLNAEEAGTASLVLLPQHQISQSLGCSFRVRWCQQFSGSNANFTRLHWLFDSTQWATSPTLEIPANGFSVLDEHGSLSFMHLGETGDNDSIQWYSKASDESWDSIVSRINNAHFPESFTFELNWLQEGGGDSARITIARVYEDGSHPVVEFGAQASHELPVGIGFSVQFTASNSDAASIEILEYAPYAPDTLAPVVQRGRLLANGGLQLEFSEPMNTQSGLIFAPDAQESVPFTWISSPGRKAIALPELSPWPKMQFRLIGFQDMNNQSMTDTTISVYPTKSVAERGDILITELMIASPIHGEWIEILNATDSAIDVNDLSIWDGSTESAKSIVPGLGWDGVLNPGHRTIIANQWDSWMSEYDFSFFAEIQPPITLANAGENIAIHSATGRIIDELTFNNSWWRGGETIGLQKKYLSGCTLEQNWIAIDNDMASSPGTPSPTEWPMDTVIQLVAKSVVALGPGIGMFTLNQFLHPDSEPSIKDGWLWQDATQPDALFWRIDSLQENSEWHITAAGVQGCLDSTASSLRASLRIGKFPEDGNIIITEIAHDPKGLSTPWGTFIELLNTSETQTLELAGCSINETQMNEVRPLPPLGRICIPVSLNKESGRAVLRNYQGGIIDEVTYSRCWHRQRQHAESGLSLVRIQPESGRVHPSAWWAWTSSAEATTGCSPGMVDKAESQVITPPEWSAIACGEYNGKKVVLFSAPAELQSPWTAVDLFNEKGMMWTNTTDLVSPFENLCPASGTTFDARDVGLNEVRKWDSDGAEPFIEIANPSATWASTENLFWSSASIPFPDDWAPISADTKWFIPPQETLAFTECPSRIESSGKGTVHAKLPSLWGSVELRLAGEGELLDAFLFQPEMEAPWHTMLHSIEKTTRDARNDNAQWITAASALGNTASSWNSWQTHPELGLNMEILRILNANGYASPSGEVLPVSFQVTAPDQEAWELHWTIENNVGTVIASNSAAPILMEGKNPIVCHWNGAYGSIYAAPGPYLLKLELHSLQSLRCIYAQAPVAICPP